MCEAAHRLVDVNHSTTSSEFAYTHYIPSDKCVHAEADRYCVLTTWDEFDHNPSPYVEMAFAKRAEPVANLVKVRP